MLKCHHSDDIDQRMTAWLSSVSQDCSEETRFSLLSAALDAFLERFEQENGPISANSNCHDNTSREPQPDTDAQSREPVSGLDQTTSCTAHDDHMPISDTNAPQPHLDEVVKSSMVVSGSESSLSSKPFLTFMSGERSEFGTGDQQQSEKRLKRKRKHHSHKHEHHAATKKARLDLDKNNSSHNSSVDTPLSEGLNSNNSSHTSSLDTPLSEDLNGNCCSQDASDQDDNNNYTSLDAPDQDDNNNYTSLDARLEQFFVCPQTNRLIPKQTQRADCETTKPAPDSAEHSSSKARRREEKISRREERVRCREENARQRCENVKPRQVKPRRRGHKKERSLLKAATIRCLVRKAFETGTYCCYKRCFLARPRLYV